MNLDILLIAVGLSMDAFAVSMASSVMYSNLSRFKKFLFPLMFGIFQAVMPLLGYYFGTFFIDFFETYAGIVTLIILGSIGINMIREGLQKENIEEKTFKFSVLFAQAVATSIDAFAVGFSLVAMDHSIISSITTIGITTFIISYIGIIIGKIFEEKLGNKSMILGGAVLIFIGIKSLL